MSRGLVKNTIAASLVLACSIAASAQTPDAPGAFGTQDEAVTIIGFTEFLPNQDFWSYSGNTYGRWLGGIPGGGGYLYAPLNMLPNGSILTQVTAYLGDNDDNLTEPGVNVCMSWVDSATGADPGFDCPVSLHTSGTPGDTAVFENTALPILYRQDIDGDGTAESVHYWINAVTWPGDTAIRMVRLLWKRQVSPAPQSPTFNDVPTSDGAFQFIEALAASGITVGCGNGTYYCPDNPVTRRQMAVFLAKALGLHWPWNAP
jgi:hypothetical protein